MVAGLLVKRKQCYSIRMVKIMVIIGSTRPNRGGPAVANWIMQLTSEHPNAEFELVDLKELNLPFLDEPEQPFVRKYTKDHTKKWSAMVDAADGFVWVHPEYNHGVNAALKNALDFLWQEWNDKPVALVGYGSAAGGARAAQQLRLIAAGLKMFDLRADIVLPNYRQYVDESGVFNASEGHTKAAHNILEELIFWAVHMATARQELKTLK